MEVNNNLKKESVVTKESEEKEDTPKTSVTHTTLVTDTTNTTHTTNNKKKGCVVCVVCDKELLRSVFGDEVIERILKIILGENGENKPLTYKILADRLGKKEELIRQAILRKKEYFVINKPDGKICHTSLSQMAINEINNRILAKKAQIDLEKAKKEEEEKAQNRSILTQEMMVNFAKNYTPKRLGTTIFLDFQDILDYEPKLADLVLDDPLKFIEDFKETLIAGNYDVKIKNLPNSLILPIENLRKENLNKIITIEGRVVSFSEVKPIIFEVKYECSSCSNLIKISQNYRTGKLREPSRCSCGRRGNFKVLDREEINACFIQLEDLQEKTDNPHSQRINAVVLGDLTNFENIKIFSPGNEIRCSGILKEVPIIKNGQQTVFLNWILEIQDAELIEKEVNIFNLTEEEKIKIDELSKKIDEKGLEEIIPSFAPDIYGFDEIKKALVLMLCNRRNDRKLKAIRNKSNILIIGDPGSAKSVLGNFVIDITPGARKALGGSSSSVGITASVLKTEDNLGGYRVEPGALVLAHDVLFLDELNNLNDEDKPKLQEGIESQCITINKANIHITMKVTCGMLAAANPKLGKFFVSDKPEFISEQFNIPIPILNRFDTIFTVFDIVNVNSDERIAEKMIKRQGNKLVYEYDKEFLRKFFCYIRNFKEPEIDEEIEEVLKKTYSLARRNNNSSIKINPRFLESLTRMCVASAKIRQSNKIEFKDIERCIWILAESEYKVSPYIVNSLKKQEKINPSPISEII